MKTCTFERSRTWRRALIGLILMMACGTMLQAQVAIPGTKVQYTFPSKWNFLNSKKVDKNTTVYHYYYTSNILVSKGDVYDRYVQEPYQPLKDYTTGLGLPPSGGMGYIGAYTNVNDKKDYQFRMVYFKVQNTVVEFRLETTKGTYAAMEKEFESILKSLTF